MFEAPLENWNEPHPDDPGGLDMWYDYADTNPKWCSSCGKLLIPDSRPGYWNCINSDCIKSQPGRNLKDAPDNDWQSLEGT